MYHQVSGASRNWIMQLFSTSASGVSTPYTANCGAKKFAYYVDKFLKVVKTVKLKICEDRFDSGLKIEKESRIIGSRRENRVGGRKLFRNVKNRTDQLRTVF